ncbi:MAG: amidohydrolase family protein [Opitutaceae bacterium]|nr:amidohydrolase family protein [Opitutaceae bacterium]
MRCNKLFALLGAAAVAASASDSIPAARPGKPLLLRGATVHTVTGAVLPATDVLLRDGKIAALGPKLAAPGDAAIVEVSGKHVYPGLISAVSGMGLTEHNSVRGSVDLAETGALNPNARTQPALNPDSDHIPVSRANGILTALSVPMSTGLIAGTSTLIRMDGWTWEDLTLRAAVALHVYWPSMAVNRDPGAARSAADQERTITDNLRRLRDAFAAARAYVVAKDSAAARTDFDSRWEAMRPVLRGARPVFVHATERKQIEAAVAWARAEKLKITLVGGIDAWKVADLLKAHDIPVIVSPVLTLPLRREDPYDASYANPGHLHAAGVRFCIANDGSAEMGTMADRNLPYQAAKAAAHGLPPAEALKAVTIYPAQLLGVAAELGSIEVGKRATLIVTDGDPLEVATQVEQAYIDGARIDLTSRHTRLRDKYQQRQEQLKAGGR